MACSRAFSEIDAGNGPVRGREEPSAGVIRGVGVATEKVTGACYRRHRHQEFLKFLDALSCRDYSSRSPLFLR